MASFVLRKADDTLWAQFKARAEKEGYTLRWLMLQFIMRYVRNGIAKSESADVILNDRAKQWASIEWGYRMAEKGWNIEKTREAYNAIHVKDGLQ